MKIKVLVQYVKEGTIVLISAAALVLLFGFTGIPKLASFAMCVILYVLLRMLVLPVIEYTKTRELVREEEILEQVEKVIEQLGKTSASIAGSKVNTIVDAICIKARKIVEKLASDEISSVHIAFRFLSIMTQSFEILQMYQDVLLGKTKVKSKEEALEITVQVESSLLPKILEALTKMAVDLDSGEVVNLKIAVRTLEDTLKMDGLIKD